MVLRKRTADRRYRVGRRIAVGGAAEIYEARADDLGRKVAIKRQLSAGRDEEADLLFYREAAVIATLDHPNVVEVLDVGQADDDLLLVTELVEGISLADLLSKLAKAGKKVPIEIACGIAGQVARGLAHAHERSLPDEGDLGIVHRDVCPANVLISRNGVPKLVDFGLATLAGREVTRAGTIRGRVRYVAPEQALGKPVDARADIFALGALLFELISGKGLYEGPDDEAVLIRAQTGDVGDIAKRLAGVDADLVSLISRAVAAKPAARTRSARDFEKQLDRFRAARGLRIDSKTLAAFVAEYLPKEDAPPPSTGKKGDLEGATVIMRADDFDTTPSAPRKSARSSDAAADVPTDPERAAVREEPVVKAPGFKGPPRKKRLERLERPEVPALERPASLGRPSLDVGGSRMSALWAAIAGRDEHERSYRIIWYAGLAVVATVIVVWVLTS